MAHFAKSTYVGLHHTLILGLHWVDWSFTKIGLIEKNP
jgi:hypothetical protein